ncbi:hypothetical protein IA57_12695 [Mangrovimonas yunxiaonensis]|uniref:T9SS C-terminal target domain-containing protein n=1 Tax=Mangrovimonas yunxiaonensis TaxID=1197477 RepID=A0A084THT2_9FLAO|nr:hypothetical protein [Mangrovimonas yunxiaonensis]KFB00268.1 hypothetical protein IA57_12695 [Mangrovimonas yunxiaonensis]
MKNFTQILCVCLFITGQMFAQQEKGITGETNWLNPWTEFQPNTVKHNEPSQILSGNITEDTKLLKKHTYLLLGSVFVTDSTTLTIEPGTVILGDFKSNGSLTVSNGSKIIAEGTETDPIVFTSNNDVKKQGDWGGLFVLGDAPINKFGNAAVLDYGLKPSSSKNISYGGENIESNSGILKYVRIEYAGKRTVKYGYFNGLTLAGIGNQTIIENIMVSYSNGNSVSVIGGNVNLSKMVSYKSSGNDFLFNYGTQSTITNSLAIRSPYESNSNRPKCLYVASYNQVDEVDLSKEGTFVTAENLTLINLSNDLESDIKIGLVKEAVYIAPEASLTMAKSVISGFNPAVILDDNIKINGENLDRIKFKNMLFNNCNGNIFTKYNPNNDDLEDWYGNSAFFNVYSKSTDAETFIDLKNPTQPDFRLRINKIIASSLD